jgi:hypothetical protein
MSSNALTSWSFSRWDKHHTCPLMFKYEVIDKRKAPQNAAMARGQKMHDAMKDYLSAPADATPPVPVEAGKASALLQEIRQFDNIVVEQQWGFDRQWKPTGWFGADTWLRSIIDVGVLYDDMACEVIDWKSGKPRGTHEDQMELFAISVMQRFPVVQHVTTRLAYTDFEHAEFGEYPRTDLAKMIEKWEAKVRPMFDDTTYLPRPGEHCRFCIFSRSNSNGKDCRYG